jgi:hypothetical protein
MKKIIITLSLIISVLQISTAQRTISGESAVGSLSIRPVPKLPPMLGQITPTFADADGNNVLDVNETATVSFILHNKGQGDAFGLKTSISVTNNANNISVTTPNVITTLKSNGTQTVTIPIKANNALSDGQTTLLISVSEANGFDINPVRLTISTAAFKAPNIQIGDYAFSSDAGSEIQKGIPITLTTMVQNKGQGKAKNVNIQFSIGDNVFATGETNFTIGELESGEGKVVTFDFFTNNRFEGSSIPVTYIISESYNKYGTNNTLAAKINEKVRPTSEIVIKPTKPTNPNQNTEQLDIVWVNPAPRKLNNKAIVAETNQITVELTAYSTQNLEKRHFSVWINGVEQIGKLGEGRLIRGDGSSSSNSYSYINTITVPEGNSSIEIEVSNAAGKKRSVPLKAIYSAGKPNLHILTIGTAPADLKYTEKDAQDFARAFANQKGDNKLFGEVNVTTILGEKATGVGIKDAIALMAYNYSEGIIAPNDVTILFISSHGYIEKQDEKFRIQGDDFNGVYYSTTSVSYEYITEKLDKMQCKKLVFIDACHSGGAKASVSAINNAITELTKKVDGITTLTSSSADEISYEHANWQNGAFTEIILKGLSGKADANKNGIITVNELYSYLENNVPDLVKSQYNGQTQHPNLTRSDLGDLPIFVVD